MNHISIAPFVSRHRSYFFNIAVCSIVIAAFLSISLRLTDFSPAMAAIPSSSVVSKQGPSQDGIMWRYTVDGWQDISGLFPQPAPPEPWLENIHPAIWALIVLQACLTLSVLVSSEFDYSRLFEKPSRLRQLRQSNNH